MARQNRADPADLRLHLLVLRCQAGDEQAFARLLEQFGARTTAYLRSLVGTDADDVQQEVWLTVYRNIRTLSNPRAFRTWLYRTTRHRAIDFLRARQRERELFDDAPPEASEAAMAAEADALPDFDESVLQAFDELTAPQREVLLLRYRDDLSYADIALVVGCPIGTVRTRLHHAKRRLHALLQRGER
jgi:RNA polymerase sigma-70 factor (ECF subfamily)